MKHLHLLFLPVAIALAASMVLSCAPNYQADIDRLNEQYAGLDSRITELEKAVTDYNTELQQLSILAAAVEQNFYITSINNHDGFFELILSNGAKVVLQQGPGNTLLPVPPVSIMQINGFHFWTLGGFLLTGPDGLPIRSTDTVPVLKFDYVTQEYLISVDGGVTFQNINVYASLVINNEVLMQVINGYFLQNSTVLIDQKMLFQVISTYIKRNYSTLFDIDVLEQVVGTYVRQNSNTLFSTELLEQIFTQYDFESYTSQIDVDHLVGVIVSFLQEHTEVLADNQVLFEIISSYLEVNQANVFRADILLEVISSYISSNGFLIDEELLTRVVASYIDQHRDVIFDTEVVRAILMRYVEKYYVQAFSQDILVSLFNLYIEDNGSTVINETLIKDILEVYIQNNYTTIITQEMITGLINTYVEQNGSTVINSDVFLDVISNYFQANYDVIIDRTLISNLFKTYVEEHKDTIISREVIESIVQNYLREYYNEVFKADIISLVVRNYFEQNTQIIKEYVGDGADVIREAETFDDYFEITLKDGTTIKLPVYDSNSRLRNRIQSVVILPEANGHVKEEKASGSKGYLELTYLISPAEMVPVIQDKFRKGDFTVIFKVTDGSGDVSDLKLYEPHEVKTGCMMAYAYTPSYGSIKGVALYIKENKTGGTDIMTEFTPVDSETEPVWEPEYVDLGLPTGRKWATCNVGATKPWEYGDYYAWGEIEPKSSYTWSNYKWCNGTSESLTKYTYYVSGFANIDKASSFENYNNEDDPARVKWQDKWRTPSISDWRELRDRCKWSWMTNYDGTGINGYLVTGPSNKSIFLPAAGKYDDNKRYYVGSEGYYYSNEINTDDPRYAHNMIFTKYDIICEAEPRERYIGEQIRPVCGGFTTQPTY